MLHALWLYGHASGARRNLVTWPLDALERSEDLRIVDDQWGNPTFVDDLAKTLLQLCRNQQTGLLHMGGADFLTRFEMTRALARAFALPEERVRPTSTEAMNQDAPRPLRSGLRTDALTSILGRSPSTLEQGLAQMRSQPDFRRDFPSLCK